MVRILFTISLIAFISTIFLGINTLYRNVFEKGYNKKIENIYYVY